MSQDENQQIETQNQEIKKTRNQENADVAPLIRGAGGFGGSAENTETQDENIGKSDILPNQPPNEEEFKPNINQTESAQPISQQTEINRNIDSNLTKPQAELETSRPNESQPVEQDTEIKQDNVPKEPIIISTPQAKSEQTIPQTEPKITRPEENKPIIQNVENKQNVTQQYPREPIIISTPQTKSEQPIPQGSQPSKLPDSELAQKPIKKESGSSLLKERNIPETESLDLRDSFKKFNTSGIKPDKRKLRKYEYVILGVTILIIIVSIFLFFNTLNTSKVPQEVLQNPERGLPIID